MRVVVGLSAGVAAGYKRNRFNPLLHTSKELDAAHSSVLHRPCVTAKVHEQMRYHDAAPALRILRPPLGCHPGM